MTAEQLAAAERQHLYAVHLLVEARRPASQSHARAIGTMAAEHLHKATSALLSHTGDAR